MEKYAIICGHVAHGGSSIGDAYVMKYYVNHVIQGSDPLWVKTKRKSDHVFTLFYELIFCKLTIRLDEQDKQVISMIQDFNVNEDSGYL